MDDKIIISKADFEKIIHSNIAASADKVLEHLWQTYEAYNPLDDERVRNAEQEVKLLHQGLAYPVSNRVYDIISELCYSYEHAAFIAGMRIGARLIQELEG